MTVAVTAGIGPAGVTNGAICIGVTAFLMQLPTGVGARGGTIPRHIGAVLPHHGVGVILSEWHARRTSLVNELKRRAVKTATDRAAEASPNLSRSAIVGSTGVAEIDPTGKRSEPGGP